MTSVVFLVSGNGGTLKFLHQAIKSNLVKAIRITCVIADRNCGALEYAQREGISNALIKYLRTDTNELHALLDDLSPDLIVTNIHKILDDRLVAKFRNKLINLHYSLLPAFKGLIGMKTIEEAVKIKSRFIGGTCHYVDEQVDNGEIISQFVLPLSYPPDIIQLQNIEFRASSLLLLNSIIVLTQPKGDKSGLNSVSILGSPVYFEPNMLVNPAVFDEQFWGRIS